jgi:hypothetical protein
MEPSNDPVEHFWKAAHELLQAARGLIDAADAVVEHQLEKSSEPKEPRLRKIDVQ